MPTATPAAAAYSRPLLGVVDGVGSRQADRPLDVGDGERDPSDRDVLACRCRGQVDQRAGYAPINVAALLLAWSNASLAVLPVACTPRLSDAVSGLTATLPSPVTVIDRCGVAIESR